MQPVVEHYKNFGALAIAVFWFAAGFMLWRWSIDKSKSLSRHAAAHRQALIFFGTAIGIAVVLGYLFFVRWFIPNFQLSGFFKALLILMVSSFLVGAVIPASKGLAERIHHEVARVGSLALIPMLILMVINSHVAVGARVIDSLLAAIMFCIWVWVDLKKRSLDKFLLFQAIYFSCFHASLLLTTYMR